MDPIAGDAFSEWLSQAIAAYGDDLLRVKGLLNIKGRQRPTVVHGVQRVFHPTVELSKWPDDDRSSRLVFILYDIEPGSLIRSLREALSLDDGAAEFNTSSPRFHAHDHP
jgi:G3E family GTPase